VPSGFRCACATVFLVAFACLALGQTKTPPDRTATPATPVEVRVQMSWWTDSNHPRSAIVRLDPLDGSGPGQSLRVSESSTTIVRVAPGRYQLTSTTPLTYARQAYGWSIELPLVAPVNYVRLSNENAVRLAPQNGLEPALNASNLPKNALQLDGVQGESEARAQIMTLLNSWITSFKARNLTAQMACYAPKMANYLEQRGLSRDNLQRQKARTFRVYSQIRRLELSNVELTIHGSRAFTTAVKSWDFSNIDADWHGRTQVSLGLAKIDSHWVIVSEQESAVPTERLQAQPRLADSRAPVER